MQLIGSLLLLQPSNQAEGEVRTLSNFLSEVKLKDPTIFRYDVSLFLVEVENVSRNYSAMQYDITKCNFLLKLRFPVKIRC